MSISDRLDETTERAARMIGSVMSRWDMDGRPDVAGGIDTFIARALAEAGLLAPAPLRAMYAEGAKPPGREWEQLWGVAFNTADEVRERLDGEPGTIIRRYVTDWEEA